MSFKEDFFSHKVFFTYLKPTWIMEKRQWQTAALYHFSWKTAVCYIFLKKFCVHFSDSVIHGGLHQTLDGLSAMNTFATALCWQVWQLLSMRANLLELPMLLNSSGNFYIQILWFDSWLKKYAYSPISTQSEPLEQARSINHVESQMLDGYFASQFFNSIQFRVLHFFFLVC